MQNNKHPSDSAMHKGSLLTFLIAKERHINIICLSNCERHLELCQFASKLSIQLLYLSSLVRDPEAVAFALRPIICIEVVLTYLNLCWLSSGSGWAGSSN